jgi:hypothetical protein
LILEEAMKDGLFQFQQQHQQAGLDWRRKQAARQLAELREFLYHSTGAVACFNIICNIDNHFRIRLFPRLAF